MQHNASSLRSNDEVLAVNGYLSSVASALLAGPARHARKGRCARFCAIVSIALNSQRYYLLSHPDTSGTRCSTSSPSSDTFYEAGEYRLATCSVPSHDKPVRSLASNFGRDHMATLELPIRDVVTGVL